MYISLNCLHWHLDLSRNIDVKFIKYADDGPYVPSILNWLTCVLHTVKNHYFDANPKGQILTENPTELAVLLMSTWMDASAVLLKKLWTIVGVVTSWSTKYTPLRLMPRYSFIRIPGDIPHGTTIKVAVLSQEPSSPSAWHVTWVQW